MRARVAIGCALALLLDLGAADSHAQTMPSVDLRTWHPSIDPEGGLVLEPAMPPGAWQWNFGAWTSYAEAPVSLRDSTGHVVAHPVAHGLFADLIAGVGLGERAAVGIDLPVFVWQKGSSGLRPTIVSGGTVAATGLGDLALLGKVALLSNDRQGVHAGFGLALLGNVSLPSGDRASFMGDGSTTAAAEVLGEYALGVGAARAAIGYKLRTEEHTWPDEAGGVTIGDEIPWAIDFAIRPKVFAPVLDAADRQAWEIGLHGSLPARPVAPFGLGGSLGGHGASALSPLLLAVDDRVALGHYRDLYLVVGGDFGLDEGLGAPALRVVVALGWAPRGHDRDSDGVRDDVDECPDLPEDKDGIQDADGCPEDDADGDGVLDEQDACPLVAGEVSTNPRDNGCPARTP